MTNTAIPKSDVVLIEAVKRCMAINKAVPAAVLGGTRVDTMRVRQPVQGVLHRCCNGHGETVQNNGKDGETTHATGTNAREFLVRYGEQNRTTHKK